MKFTSDSMTLDLPDCAQQGNSFDCGVYVLFYAELLLQVSKWSIKFIEIVFRFTVQCSKSIDYSKGPSGNMIKSLSMP